MRLLFILRGPCYIIIIQLKLHSGSFASLSPFLFENLELQLLPKLLMLTTSTLRDNEYSVYKHVDFNVCTV